MLQVCLDLLSTNYGQSNWLYLPGGGWYSATEKHNLLKIALVILNFDRSFVFPLTGCLHIAILADTIEAPYLRITPGHYANIGEKYTLFKA